jgi:ADP-ribosylglycohydrolase
MKLKDARSDRAHGVMFGLAYGDALGRPTEFVNASVLVKIGGPFRRQVGINAPRQGIVTDDTQMSIAVAKAALGVTRPTPDALTTSFIAHFIRWYNDPKSKDGQRAPGNTCLSAVHALKQNPIDWMAATVRDSKGNGANMRVSPLALRTDWTWDELAGASQLQAAITHGHPTALAATELTAVAVRLLLEGVAAPTEGLIDHLIAYAYDQRLRYREGWLGHLWQAPPRKTRLGLWDETQPLALAATVRGNWWDDADGLLPAVPRKAQIKAQRVAKSPEAWIQRGWDRMIDVLTDIKDIPRNKRQDPCKVAGGGWIAEEALTAALHTLLCFPGDPTNALRRAAFTDGDSDSIASITGALAGAAYGLKAFPSHWIANLEYRRELADLTDALTAAARR